MYCIFCERNTRLMTIACYINMVKTLDTVDYSTLSKKLEAVGFKGNLIDWL